MVTLARPVFESGPNDDVAVVDVYSTTDSTTRNALTSKLTTFGQGVTDIFGKSTEALKDLGHKLGTNQIDLAAAKDRIQGALAGSRNDINYLATGIQGTIFTDATGKDRGTDYVREANKLMNTVKVVTSKGARISSGQDQNKVRSMLGIVSDLTGLNIFKSFDLGAETALIKGMVIEIGKWGIPDLLDDLLQNTDSRTAYSAVSRSSRQLASTSDIDSIEAIIARLGPQVLTQETPNFASTFLANYRFPLGTTEDKYAERLAQLVRVMTLLQPNWATTQRRYVEEQTGDEVIEDLPNLAVMTNASAHAKLLFRNDEAFIIPSLIAGHYPSKTAVSLLKEQYPYIAIL